MGILDNLLGANVDPMQMQIAQMLGVQMDPKQLQRRSRAEGLSRIGQALMQAGGGAGGTLAALGAGLQDARTSGDDLVSRELQRAMQFKQLQESQAQLKARAAMQEQMKTLLPQALKNLPPEVAQIVSLQAASGDPAMMNKAFETLLNPPQPKIPSNKAQLAFAAANGDANAQAALDRLNADELARAQAGRTSVTVGAPDIPAIIAASTEAAAKASAKASGGQFADLNNAARQASEYAQNVDLYRGLREGQGPVPGFVNTVGQSLRSVPGVGSLVEQAYGGAENADRTAEAARLENDLTLSKSGLLKGPTSDRDIGFLKDAGPSLLRTNRGLELLSAISRAKADQMNNAARLANELQDQGLSPNEIQTRINDYIQNNPITTQFWQAAGYTPKGERSGSSNEPAPAQPSAGPKRYKFVNGELVEG